MKVFEDRVILFLHFPDDDFLRDFLLKTAKRQHKKGQLSQVNYFLNKIFANKAVDTFCQLLIATDGHLRSDEMAVLVDVCREKVQLQYFSDELICFERLSTHESSTSA